MSTLINFTLVVVMLLVYAGTVALAVWAWRRLRVSFLLWFIAKTAVVLGAGLPFLTAGKAEKEALIAKAQARADQAGVTLGDLVMQWMGIRNLLPMLVLACLLVLLAAELMQLASRLDPGFQPHASLRLAYRVRWLFGALAVILTVLTSFSYLWVL